MYYTSEHIPHTHTPNKGRPTKNTYAPQTNQPLLPMQLKPNTNITFWFCCAWGWVSKHTRRFQYGERSFCRLVLIFLVNMSTGQQGSGVRCGVCEPCSLHKLEISEVYFCFSTDLFSFPVNVYVDHLSIFSLVLTTFSFCASNTSLVRSW